MAKLEWEKARRDALPKQRMEPIPPTPSRRKEKPLWYLGGIRWSYGRTCGRCGGEIEYGERQWIKRTTGELRHERCYRPKPKKA